MLPASGVVLVGGPGSRLHPLNSAGTPKALLPGALLTCCCARVRLTQC